MIAAYCKRTLLIVCRDREELTITLSYFADIKHKKTSKIHLDRDKLFNSKLLLAITAINVQTQHEERDWPSQNGTWNEPEPVGSDIPAS